MVSKQWALLKRQDWETVGGQLLRISETSLRLPRSTWRGLQKAESLCNVGRGKISEICVDAINEILQVTHD